MDANLFLFFFTLTISINAAVIQREVDINENNVGKSSTQTIVRVMPEGPKVAIKSTAINMGMKTGNGRLRNSDFHEVFVSPYRYLEKEIRATALLTLAKGNDGEKEGVEGVVHFSQTHAAGSVTLSGVITGLNPGKYGLHIHEFGDLSENCQPKKIGRHYNPFKSKHGSPTSRERHVGDLGNIAADAIGTAYINITDPMLSLVGGRSVIGRSIVIDGDIDYFLPVVQETSSRPIACGVIGRTG